MALKKSELYSRIWTLCDNRRGGRDASQYKDYVLVLVFEHTPHAALSTTNLAEARSEYRAQS